MGANVSFNREHPYVPEPVTEGDMRVATIAFGWVLGFCLWTIATAWQQTHRVSVYTVLIWGEIVVCLVFAVLCWLFMIEVIPPSFAFFFSILTCWALQVQFLLQIIINRVNLLWSDARHQRYLKYGVAALITAINISVYCIWVPARLQLSDTYVHVNEVWDRCEKCIYLVVDACLNWLFIRVVRARLVGNGLDRYRPLVRTNQRLILLSISLDALIVGMMSYGNTFVCTPIAYLGKLAIEMSLGSLIVDISSAKPERGTVGAAFEGLKIAVSTQTTTTAYHLDDEGSGNGAEPLRTTRTPARPDLHLRLEKMRRERRERKEALARGEDPDVRIEMGGSTSRRGSDFSIDEEKDIELDEWQSSIHHLPREERAGGPGGVRFVITDERDEKM
ncbi:uncharacterized protein JCM10292_003432 [Rhodotorula paludigena]|uniref:uncharacterized protein n=1 Tax=Rhodotorula paludigena TaxID=86838 RepID=UPI003174B70A